MNREAIIQEYGDSTLCVPIDRIEEIVDAVMKYNFYYKFKKFLGEEFKQAEARMSELAKQYRWAARGSWNAFVPKEEREKKVVDLSWMSEYTPKEV